MIWGSQTRVAILLQPATCEEVIRVQSGVRRYRGKAGASGEIKSLLKTQELLHCSLRHRYHGLKGLCSRGISAHTPQTLTRRVTADGPPGGISRPSPPGTCQGTRRNQASCVTVVMIWRCKDKQFFLTFDSKTSRLLDFLSCNVLRTPLLHPVQNCYELGKYIRNVAMDKQSKALSIFTIVSYFRKPLDSYGLEI